MEFSVIVAVDDECGIGKGGSIPWKDASDMKYFREKTSGVDDKTKHNALIMGRKTWESLPKKPLPGRLNIIISSTLEVGPDCSTNNIIVVRSFDQALVACGKRKDELSNVWVIGGVGVYSEAVKHPLCTRLYVTKIAGTHNCDVFFPFADMKDTFEFSHHEQQVNGEYRTRVLVDKYNGNSEEQAYLNVIQLLLGSKERPNRTESPTLGLFGEGFKFSLANGVIPLLTSRRIGFKTMAHELLWFISGATNIDYLKANNVHIWDGNTSREFLDSRGLTYFNEGEAGANYGFNWRHFGAGYIAECDRAPGHRFGGVDQLANVISSIKNDPWSRRHVVTAWDPASVVSCCLPQCFMENTLVLTNKGYKYIQNIADDDLLYTHLGNYQKINKKYITPYSGEVIELKLEYHPHVIKCTPNHPFYSRKEIIIEGNKTISDPEWIDSKDLNDTCYIGMKINDKSIIPEFEIKKGLNQHDHKIIKFKLDKPEYWFMMGYYLGDGCLDWGNNGKNRFKFVVSHKQIDKIYPELNKVVKLGKPHDESTGCSVYDCSDKVWYEILKHFGRLAHNKIIPQWVHDAPTDLIEHFIKGYISADGYIKKKKTVSVIDITTTSNDIAFSIQRLYLKLGKICYIQKQIRPKTCVIEGRTVNQRDTYTIKLHSRLLGKTFIENGYCWFKYVEKNPRQVENINVYNFDVGEDHTYTVENLSTHNCHIMFQFYVSSENDTQPTHLSIMIYMRSGDIFHGIPFNIASYALLTHMVATICNLQAKELSLVVGDIHLYNTHIEAAKELVKRPTRPFPTISFSEKINKMAEAATLTIDDFTIDDFHLSKYYPGDTIKVDMVV